MQHIPLSTFLLLVKHFIQVQPPSVVGTRLMIKKARTAWLTAALQSAWEDEVEPSVQNWVNVIHECVPSLWKKFSDKPSLFIQFSIYQQNILDAVIYRTVYFKWTLLVNILSYSIYYIIKYCC